LAKPGSQVGVVEYLNAKFIILVNAPVLINMQTLILPPPFKAVYYLEEERRL